MILRDDMIEIFGSVLKVEMATVYRPSQGIAMDKPANDDVVPLSRCREADGLTDQALQAHPSGQRRALALLRVA
jgi:hypothetical protein